MCALAKVSRGVRRGAKVRRSEGAGQSAKVCEARGEDRGAELKCDRWCAEARGKSALRHRVKCAEAGHGARKSGMKVC